MTTYECKLYLGPMFSEKTSEIVRHIKRAKIAGLKCIIIKFEEDNRYGDDNVIYTHDGVTLRPSDNLRIVKTLKLSDIELTDEKVIAIDEGQFFDDIPEIVDKWMREERRIYISALDGDYLRRPFGRISELIPLCTHITKLSGICTLCKKNNSSYTLRIVPGNNQKDIGTTDKYMSTCLQCYLSNIK